MSGLASSERWELLPSNPHTEQRLVDALGVSPLVARTLSSRGISDIEQARRFLNPSLDRDWADPLDIPGMKAAADRIEEAITAGQTIAVFGDFDVDGMSSTCLLTLALRRLGAAQVEPFIPDRFSEGYGLSHEALARVRRACNPDLVVTVDNGIAAANEVAWLVEQGVDVVITDHHEPADLVPQGVPVTDPKLSADCRSRELAGAGVALKLVCELGRRLGQPRLWREYTEVASLGTISDMMLLEDENRALVADGVAQMRHTKRPGIVALAEVAGVNLAEITSDSLPFSLVPRLNAAGRMGCTDIAFELLLTDDPAQATTLAARLESVNQERRDIEAALAEEALRKAEQSYSGGRVVVVSGKNWHEGVKGIVASRIVSRYQVPAILFSVSEGVARGSGRSVGQVDLFHAVEQCADLLVRFGGHAGAVGVTVEESKLDAFRERLEEVLSELPAQDFVAKNEISALVSLDELNVASIASLELMQPFGQGNKKPLFACTGISMKNRGCVGVTGEHLRFIASDGLGSVPAIMFRTPNIERAANCEESVDVVFEPVVETWQGKTKPKLMVRDIIYREPSTSDDASQSKNAELIEGLFARATEILSRKDYAGIADAKSFNTKVAGVSFEGRQEIIARMIEGEVLAVERQPHNSFDPNAIALVRGTGEQVGFFNKDIAAELAPVMDTGVRYLAKVAHITGGEDGQSLGVNVSVEKLEDEQASRLAHQAAAARKRLEALKAQELDDELRHALIGNAGLHQTQQLALDQLAQGISTLVVMATGRGKSLIFHLHAARMALREHKASVFVYPLRALVSDQAYHLEQIFGELGMHVATLTGETSLDERDRIFAALGQGSCDIILTTPEFLAIHNERFAQAGRVGFVVVDEAHHAAAARGGNRSSYTRMPEVLDALGSPVALALTATAATPVATEICSLLGIQPEHALVDESLRANLSIVDRRDLRGRETALISLVSSGEKCVIYVNSREQSISLARTLRRALPDMGQCISFYNAGLTRAERTAVEEAFREGSIRCIVSTSAFGEGVNLPDIRNVVLYHMPFGEIEFNQMSGRAGRDGADARIHLMYGERDARINERILEAQAPERAVLATLYRALATLGRDAREQGEDSFSMTNAQIADFARQIDARFPLEESGVSSAIGVFRELGFLTTSGFSSARRITMAEAPERIELDHSIRYLEGLRLREEFNLFKEWALGTSAHDALTRINRPITPDFGRHVG